MKQTNRQKSKCSKKEFQGSMWRLAVYKDAVVQLVHAPIAVPQQKMFVCFMSCYHLPGVGEWGGVPSSRGWGVGGTIFQGLESGGVPSSRGWGVGGTIFQGLESGGYHLPGVGEWGVPSSRGWGVGGTIFQGLESGGYHLPGVGSGG